MTETVTFHTHFHTDEFAPFKETFNQVVPEVGLVFSIEDNGYGNGGASAYVVTFVDKLNKRGFPKKFFAKALHKTYNVDRQPAVNGYIPYDNGKYTITNETECLVEKYHKIFSFRLRNGDAYHRDRLSFINWGSITTSQLYDK